MKARVLFAVLMIPLLVCGCALITGPRVTGRWEGTATFGFPVSTPREIGLVLTETDGAITGSLEWSETYVGTQATDVTGSREDGNIRIEGAVHGSLLTLEGVLERGTIAGTCTYRGVTDAWQVTRAG